MAAVEDVTVGLPSLQFEAALTQEEKELLYLRGRSHALTASACAQAAFLVAILNDTRQKIIEAKFPIKQKSSKLLQEIPKRDPVLVGIIGCGRLGKQLANTLLKFSDVQPEELFLSSRRPETLSSFQEKGVNCGFDNIKVCSTVHILFLCCLPSQFPTVAKEIRGHLICPVYVLVGVFVFINMCTGMGLQQDEIISLCNTIMFGLGPTDDPQDGISLDDINCDDDTLTISSNMEDKKFFPLFDLGNVIAKQKRLEQRLVDSNKNLRRMFAKRYRAVFDKYATCFWIVRWLEDLVIISAMRKQ
ncbi:NADP-dependent oxidoreductase domain-containing protein 1 [Acropora cervicornis]|uniref:NADP-dependent oxidoreductase domain-containing protein 1 n=1 Tax=Acropora cervicornis TaxID=6130 RepID=A0AAD9PZX6_ACRCE|nr:NADP-dependent oxidoreductase domain-containing protein 1 [Acropora cervicornis]